MKLKWTVETFRDGLYQCRGLRSSDLRWGIYCQYHPSTWIPRAYAQNRGVFVVVELTANIAIPGSRPEFFERLLDAKAYCEEMTSR